MVKLRPDTNSLGNKELDKAEEQFKAFDENVKSMTLDRMNLTPKKEYEPQTKLSSQDLSKSRDIYLKPAKVVGDSVKFNEDYRQSYEYDKEVVQFIAENLESRGETIELWTKPYAGVPAMFWQVPVNVPVWGPRYLAERIKACYYHRLRMESKTTDSDSLGQYYGQMAVDTTIPRLDCRPVSTQRSVFFSQSGF